MKIERLLIGKLKPNPNNPRFIRDEKFKSLVESLNNCPELFEARPCICSDRTDELIIIGGNMRWRAARELKWKEVPVIIMPGLTEAQEKEITIRDNGAWGEWDFDALANTWGDLPLDDWGVDLPEDWLKDPDMIGMDQLGGNDPGDISVSVKFAPVVWPAVKDKVNDFLVAMEKECKKGNITYTVKE